MQLFPSQEVKTACRTAFLAFDELVQTFKGFGNQ
jgi:hypothetical protein